MRVECAFDAHRINISVVIERKTARLTVLVDPAKKDAFEQLCARLDLTPSQVVRQLIREFLARHDVSYTPSGIEAEPAAAGKPNRAGKGAARRRKAP